MPTQAERRATTRRTLLDAAADVLVEDGLGGVTTATVIERAGLSNGALYAHFPSRLDLVAATLEHVLARLRHDYDTTFAAVTEAGATPDAATALELLWSAMSDRQFAAVLEIYTRARTDADLFTAIHPIVTEHGRYVADLVDRVARALSPDPDDVPSIVAIASLAIHAMQGVVVGQMAGTAPGSERELLDVVAGLVDPDHAPATWSARTDPGPVPSATSTRASTP